MNTEKWSFWRRDQEGSAGEDELERSGSESSPADAAAGGDPAVLDPMPVSPSAGISEPAIDAGIVNRPALPEAQASDVPERAPSDFAAEEPIDAAVPGCDVSEPSNVPPESPGTGHTVEPSLSAYVYQ